mmetsp:Transcript_40318/g.111039  ORF Transcript_40318/g.111039 Transcript_40318/m.111039 type:complete len:96 (+) Transcript_40318:461-748(+)
MAIARVAPVVMPIAVAGVATAGTVAVTVAIVPAVTEATAGAEAVESRSRATRAEAIAEAAHVGGAVEEGPQNSARLALKQGRNRCTVRVSAVIFC